METNEIKASLVLSNRKMLNLTDISDVVSFDELTIYLITKNNGNLLIEGNDLHITTLDVASGNMTVEGMICSMIYDDKELNVKLATLSVNTVVTMVSTKQISDAYKITKLYEVMYQADGKNVIGYVKANNLNVYENGIKSPAGTTKECIQGLLHYKELEVKQNGKVIGWLMNNADIDVYKKDAKTATINFNGVKATVESKYVVTPTPTPTPTACSSPSTSPC